MATLGLSQCLRPFQCLAMVRSNGEKDEAKGFPSARLRFLFILSSPTLLRFWTPPSDHSQTFPPTAHLEKSS